MSVITKKNQSVTSTYALVMVMVCVLLNMTAGYLADFFGLPFWLDTIGTMAVAIAFGPAMGAFTGGLSSLLLGLISVTSLPFVPINILTGVMIGLLFPRNTQNDRLAIVTLAMLNGLLSSLISAPMAAIIYNGYTGNRWGDALRDMLENLVNSSGFNTLVAEMFVSLPDRVVSILAALLFLRYGEWQRGKIQAWKRRKQEKAKEKSKEKSNEKAAMLLIPVLLAPVLFPAEVFAEGEDLNFEYEEEAFDSYDGILSPEANAVLQTPDGYIWVGTYSGLYRYDGVYFEEVRLDENVRNVKSLYVDSSGRLWVGTNDSGILCYDFEQQHGTMYSTANGLPSDSIRCICEDDRGNIYVSTDREMARIGVNGDIKVYSEWAEIDHVTSYAPLPDGRILGVTHDGVLFMFKDNLLLFSQRYAPDGKEYSAVATDGNEVVVGTTQSDLEVFTIREDRLNYKGRVSGMPLSGYNCMRYDPDFGMYFLCSSTGMGYMDPQAGKVQYFTNSVFGGSVDDVCVDSQKNIWFASGKHGLVKYSYTPFRNLYRKAEISKDVVNALYKDGDMLYIGTDSGLRQVELSTCELQFPKLTEWVGGNRVRHITKDSHGNLWISMYGNEGVIWQDPEGEIHSVDFVSQGMSTPNCRFVEELSNGDLVVSCIGLGLVYLRDKKIVSVIGSAEGMSNTTILSVYEREDGILMAASDGDGIYLIRDGRLVGHISQTEGLRTGVVMRIVPCTDGLLYVSSNALYYDNGESIRRLENFPFYNNFDVILDEDGLAWIVSSAGLFVLQEADLLEDREDYNCTLLDRDWGLTASFNSNAWNIKDGNDLYLCCVDGVRIFDTVNYNREDVSYQMGLKLVETQDMEYTQVRDQLVLPPVAGRIRFHIAVNNFTLSNPLVHYYLEGSGDPGITCYQDEITPLSFTNLPFGEYVFHIEVLDDTTGQIIRDEQFKIVKEAQMYEEPYFSLYLMLVNSLMLGYFFWLFMAIRSRNKRIRSLRREIQTDPMTGLLNKAGAHAVMEATCATEAGTLLMIDLDSFKLVNDLYGHDMGDRILIRFAELIREAIHEDDPAGRLGGDEFVAFLNNTMDEDDVAEVCRILNQGIVKSAKEYMGEEMNIPLGASIGAVRVPLSGRVFDEVFPLADKALYNVKQNGKHGYAFYQRTADAKEQDKTDGEQSKLSKIMQVIEERNEGKGAYFVNFDRMQVLYRYLKRESLHGRRAAFARICLSAADGESIAEDARETLEDALVRGLKKNDVVSSFSGNYFALISDAEAEEGEQKLREITAPWLESGENKQRYRIRIEANGIG